MKNSNFKSKKKRLVLIERVRHDRNRGYNPFWGGGPIGAFKLTKAYFHRIHNLVILNKTDGTTIFI